MMIKNTVPVPKTAKRFPAWIKKATEVKRMTSGADSDIGLAVIRGDVVLFHWGGEFCDLSLDEVKQIRKQKPFSNFVYIGKTNNGKELFAMIRD